MKDMKVKKTAKRLGNSSPAVNNESMPRRAAIYLFYDPHGIIDDYVVYFFTQLKPHVQDILLMSNCQLAPGQAAKLDGLVSEIVERENIGFDVMAYRDGLERFGWDNLATYDELILLNYTFFGPLQPFADLFTQMDKQAVDFWGLTDHAEVSPHPFALHMVMPRHIQSHWIAVRKKLLAAPEFRDYWENMPLIDSYNASILHHETRFTQYFASRGFTYQVVWPSTDFYCPSAVLEDAPAMVRAGCTIVKRRTFFNDPMYMDRFALLGQPLMEAISECSDYPLEIIWQNLTRTCKPRDLVHNLNLLEVLPDTASPATRKRAEKFKVAALAHIFYPQMTQEIVTQLRSLPGAWDLYVTTASEDKAAEIKQELARLEVAGEVRVLPSNRGRDISAFLLGMEDVLRNGKYDLVLKIHSKLSPQDGPNVGGLFKRHLYENLLGTPGHCANVVDLFNQHPNLGMVVAPIPHIGYPTMGHAWFENKKPAAQLLKQMNLQMVLDDTTPVAAYGSMFICRPQLLLPLLDLGLDWEDFPDEGGYKDGSIAHVIERLFAYVVLAQGHHVREVFSPKQAAINYGALQYRAQAVGKYLAARPDEAVRDLQNVSRFISREEFKNRHPQAFAKLKPVYKALQVSRMHTKYTLKMAWRKTANTPARYHLEKIGQQTRRISDQAVKMAKKLWKK